MNIDTKYVAGGPLAFLFYFLGHLNLHRYYKSFSFRSWQAEIDIYWTSIFLCTSNFLPYRVFHKNFWVFWIYSTYEQSTILIISLKKFPELLSRINILFQSGPTHYTDTECICGSVSELINSWLSCVSS